MVKPKRAVGSGSGVGDGVGEPDGAGEEAGLADAAGDPVADGEGDAVRPGVGGLGVTLSTGPGVSSVSQAYADAPLDWKNR